MTELCYNCCRSPQGKSVEKEEKRDRDRNKKAEVEEEEEKSQEQLEEEELMKKMMGFTHFDTTKVSENTNTLV